MWAKRTKIDIPVFADLTQILVGLLWPSFFQIPKSYWKKSRCSELYWQLMIISHLKPFNLLQARCFKAVSFFPEHAPRIPEASGSTLGSRGRREKEEGAAWDGQKQNCSGSSLVFLDSDWLWMGLDQLQMAPLVPDNSLQRLFTTQGKVFVM